jgi:hypothetical protein
MPPDGADAFSIETLGEVDVPSGDLLLLDFGYLQMWSGDEIPVLADGDGPPAFVERLNSSVDIVLDGRDAPELARRLDRANGRGVYYFDVPASQADEVVQGLTAAARDAGLDATPSILTSRIPHAKRARLLLANEPHASDVLWAGPWAVAVRGLPRDRTLLVKGLRMDSSGPDFDRWQSVWVECSSQPVASSSEAGHVLVDEARLMFADLEAISAIRVRPSADDKVDVVFWGRDETALASRLEAGAINEGGSHPVHGWLSLGWPDARAQLERLDDAKAAGNLLVRVDVRAHTDIWAILRDARSSPTGSGSIRAAGASACGFFTSWGDGAFAVYRDLDAQGHLARVRVELGAPDIVERSAKLHAG